MATLLTDLVTEVRLQLREETPRFWSNAELLGYMRHGINDLWGAILDVHGEHYLTINDTTVRVIANQDTLDGVPANCFRVQYLEPRDTTSNGTAPWLQFLPRKWNSQEMAYARSLSALDTGTRDIYYAVSGEGSPIAAPVIRIAPKLSTNLNMRLAYNPTLVFSADGYNPVPGESDHALKCWTLAFARGKESSEGLPDAGWLSVYATEKQSILTRIVPRQEQEPEYVMGMFDGWS